MNLCGGITSISELELLSELPMEDLGLTPRQRKPTVAVSSQSRNTGTDHYSNPSTRSSSRGRGHHIVNNSGTTSAQPGASSSSSSAMLNPVSKDDMAKMRSRQQQSHPLRSMKSSSILMKKLESGFNVTWIDKEGNGQAVNLSTNSDKSCLRIRSRSRDESDNENDGFKSNQSDLRLKIRHIARVGSDRDGPIIAHDIPGSKASSHFVIKMKQAVGEWIKFKFIAESLAERDAVVLAIRSLMDQAKFQLDERSRKSISAHDRPESRSEHNDSSRSKDFRESDSLHGSDMHRHSSRSLLDDKYAKSTRGVNRAGFPEDFGRASEGSSRKGDLLKRTGRGGRLVSHPHNVDNEALFDELGCNPMNCQSQALAAVEDGELLNFATNQIAGPWCTDDVCTASLNDFADSMKGIFNAGEAAKNSKYFVGQKHRQKAEKYITDFLGDNTAMGELLSVKDLWTIAETSHVTEKGIQKRRIQNRARHVDGKALRLKGLRTQMTFNGSMAAKKIAFVQTTCSFDDVNRCGKWGRKVQSDVLEVAGQLDSSAFLDKDLIASEESGVLYYDSDPEDARERTLKRGPRRAVAERENVLDDGATAYREALNILGSSVFGIGRKWRRHADEVVLDIIEATKNEKFTLMWHPTQTKEENGLPAAVCVKLWVEAGVYLIDGTFLLPKLTWLPVHEGNLHARILNTSADSPGSLDLLDVCRVKECESIDRDVYPFANVDRSFVIQTQTGKFLFETQSRQERGRVVNGLKLVIARLASLLMLRDLRAVDEFFGGNNSVPGEAPVWARSERTESSRDFSGGHK
ncbi:hypothetical protein IV203_036116 [Nitzschia inconspicua]|uniref:Uncharacterized protein n=1 Tax=Nitzschia inconspicua TaxID=303405 RepID=A0A9K3PVL2_9STRA|nr:hypothetical protein IV203_030493 [Nitzschia inconspicua]KAG7361016.1 hypothetical protein IV203_036116 [Nitzschia inconspicua]